MSNSGLSLYQDELLELLVEECAELIQEKSKIFRFGIASQSHHIQGLTHAQCLTQELGDILTIIDLITKDISEITSEEIEKAKQRKLEKLATGKWTTHFPVNNLKPTHEVVQQTLTKAKKDLSSWKNI